MIEKKFFVSARAALSVIADAGASGRVMTKRSSVTFAMEPFGTGTSAPSDLTETVNDPGKSEFRPTRKR